MSGTFAGLAQNGRVAVSGRILEIDYAGGTGNDVVVTDVTGVARNHVVTRADDPVPDGCRPGDCSLREAIIAANASPGDDAIQLAAVAYVLSVAGRGEDATATGDLDVTDSTGTLAITGAGAAVTIIHAGGSTGLADRVFHVLPNTTLRLNSLSVTGGYNDNLSQGLAGLGAGVLNQGTLVVTNSSVSGNVGGGIASREGSVTIGGSTVSGNSAATNGAGIDFVVDGDQRELRITNSTISGNSAPGHAGGGIFITGTGGGPRVTITNTTISDNLARTGGGVRNNFGNSALNIRNTIIAGNTPDDVVGGYLDQGNNLVGGDPRLGPLADNGGSTLTHALLPGSPAIDAGDNAAAPATDQRGVARPQDGDGDGTATVDIGAVEAANDAPTLMSFARSVPPVSPTNANILVFRATFNQPVTGVDAADFAVNGATTATVTGVSVVSASVYDVTVSGGDLAGFNGTVGLDLSGSQDITNLAGNALPAGEPATDEAYTVDNDAPGLASFTRQTPSGSATNADSLVFRVTFDEAVTGVGTADFAVSGTTTATVTGVSAVSASVYDVTVSGGNLAGFNGAV